MTSRIPDHVLIIGAGEFGLSTALSLLKRSDAKITILDASPQLPNPSGSSVDASRIIRADYASKPYSALAAEAQTHWRDQSDLGWGGQGRYNQTGFALVAHKDTVRYVHEALDNVRTLAKQGLPIELDKIEQLDDQTAIRRATGYEYATGEIGYVNWNSGWAHAEKVVQFAIEKVKREGGDRVTLRPGSKVDQILVEDGDCKGAALIGGERVLADLTILAAGAWSPSLIDLQGRCVATGQALAFIDISPKEQAEMENRPVTMNFSKGLFVMPPESCHFKIARHGFGHKHLQPAKHPDGSVKKLSIPQVGVEIPEEAAQELRNFLKEITPQMSDRPFIKTRLCWYCDTPNGDFLIDYYPHYTNLFVATGGSGHGFKFFPVLGEKIVDCVEGKLDPAFAKMWGWSKTSAGEDFYCEDGSRGGMKGLQLNSEKDETRPQKL